MAKNTETVADVGVIIGRFQVPNLHHGHIELIEHVCSLHKKVIIFLGLAHTKATKNNPLDFESRKQMILEKFPNVIVLYIKDCKEDEVWSKKVDEQISDITGPSQTVMLYGSRDSFISHYKGKRPTTELVQKVYTSGSEIRKDISRTVMNTPEFRAGVVWATHNKFDTAYTTVDIAVVDFHRKRVLLARKPDEKKYRFIGGFSDTKSNSFEEDARREVMEEAHVELTDVKYIGSIKVPDWRYRAEKDVIKTLFFIGTYQHGMPKADDDIAEVRWFDYSELKADIMEDVHQPLLVMLMKHLD